MTDVPPHESDTDPDDLDGTVSWRELLEETRGKLAAAGIGVPDVDARRIVEEATGDDVVVVADRLATVRGVARLDRMVARRVAGEPLQYVLGSWGFRRLDLFVDGRVLIPRPETEVVCGLALDEIDRVGAAVGATIHDRLPVADLGTGSGAIALAIVDERPFVDVWATDVSAEALQVASANAAGVGRASRRVRLAEGSWFEALPDELRSRLGVIVANPPYVAEGDDLPPEVADWEPRGALVAGPDGLDDLRRIVAGAPAWLRPGGALVVELAPHQAAEVAGLARAAGLEPEIGRDLTGRDRAVVARLPDA
ncbi:MAG: peptide chain release factor N(5)-glutamine methyltransferase [Actinomycetota bacterium]|nr:peptide chain release factor N(5)-glutamine methyltransferase [Actinomycetota bacterium]